MVRAEMIGEEYLVEMEAEAVSNQVDFPSIFNIQRSLFDIF